MIHKMKEQTEIRKRLHAIALDAPKTSGVYLWKDESGTVIYVGKAKSLKNRLSSYFTSNRDLKTRILVSRAHTIEYITTGNEYEALLLENTLIKKYSPRYNINLKDDKSYPVIRITNEAFPRIFRTRRIIDDGSQYFGPFPDVGAIDGFLDFIKRNYRFRKCKILKKRASPCLYYHIGRCGAPCCDKISEADYKKDLDEIRLLLDGDTERSIARLEAAMKEAAKALQFEKAARLRDGVAAIRELREQNAVVDMDPESRDYIAWAAEGIMVTFAVLRMRNGKLTGRDLYRVRSLKNEEEILPEFLMAFYTDAAQVPPRIFVPSESGLALAAQWFSDALGIKTSITVIKANATEGVHEKRHSAAMAMARFNAKEDAARRLREHGDFPALEELKTVLGLPVLPSQIEGFDIAHIGGRLPVASLITFRDGNPDRKNYRMFRLRTTDGVIDDFASMREVTTRRYTRLINEGSDLPDLVLIDGGIGQVNAVQEVLDVLGADIPVIGLAKRDEEIWLPGHHEPICLPKRSDALRLLQRVRDETHRFATTRNQRLRTKENTTLVFENLPGIGPKKAVKLLDRYGSLEHLAEKAGTAEGIAEIAATVGISIQAAKKLASALPALIEARKIERKKRTTSGISTAKGGVQAEDTGTKTSEYIADLALRAAEQEPSYGPAKKDTGSVQD